MFYNYSSCFFSKTTTDCLVKHEDAVKEEGHKNDIKIYDIFFYCLPSTQLYPRKNVHSNYFLSKPSFRLAGHVIRTTFAHSFLTCAQFCSREPRCISLNYKDNLDTGGKSVCELNSERAITSALVHDENYSYATEECVSFKCFSYFKFIFLFIYFFAFLLGLLVFQLDSERQFLIICAS